MNYLISRFDGFIVEDKIQEIYRNVQYLVKNVDNPFLLCNKNGEEFRLIELKSEDKNILAIKHKSNTYYILSPTKRNNCSCVSFEFENKHISISISSSLQVVVDGKIEFYEDVEGIAYSSFEIVSKFCVVYFVGARNYMLILEKDKVVVASYYDECNIKDKERFFMYRLNDSLNHGRVFHINEQKVENYLVYLDDYDLNLNSRFVAHVFLDCVKAGNFKYCNNLLCEDLKQKKEENIKEFFLEFDAFCELEENEFALIKKNTLAGIYKFEIDNALIQNIISY